MKNEKVRRLAILLHFVFFVYYLEFLTEMYCRKNKKSADKLL